MMIDLDNFKKINDTYGHHIGDIVLKTTAKIIEEQIRPKDYVFRYGGEEFLVLLPDTKLNESELIGERIRKKIYESFSQDIKKYLSNEEIENEILYSSLINIKNISASIGINSFPEINSNSYEELLRKADCAMYYAKEKGRNQVILYEEGLEEKLYKLKNI
jgi:diguanylate cyclase